MQEFTNENFLKLIQDVFKEDSRTLISFDTDLHTMTEWSSLQAMIVVSEIDRAFDVILSAQDMREAKTIAHLYERVKQKLF